MFSTLVELKELCNLIEVSAYKTEMIEGLEKIRLCLESLGDWPMPSLKLDALLAADGSPQASVTL